MQRLAWQERAPALAPAGLVSTGAQIRSLLLELERRDAQELQGLEIVAGAAIVCLLGPEDRLPWVDGVRYCAPAPDAPGLWLPTAVAPVLAADLVLAALERRVGQGAVLLWPDPSLVLPLHGARAVTPRLLAWLARELG